MFVCADALGVMSGGVGLGILGNELQQEGGGQGCSLLHRAPVTSASNYISQLYNQCVSQSTVHFNLLVNSAQGDFTSHL